ncbi:TetR family transcriptional regulator [Asanoa ishikariensis]|uniref:Transcriptional regulator, TetR family n=1 Tax=Asanoa ishikariensis TaxID=137265 RepID=A0A1H3S400_9ACTN|nr:TetR/AcrR family transcriptional regulator [Asanoa ishikariensis]GIF66585.1 TetR family transcriptional regulator [Asanoa ishikariensis]SDZ31889.1 transcriptional regulator, TetR family [Asanoa ishikariensis]
MARLSRAEAQSRNREKVLAAAHAEFLSRGYRAAKIDSIAERAELTRGAVYSNFPGKRALYFAVLAAALMSEPLDPAPTASTTPREALAAFARAWCARLPLFTDDDRSPARLGADLLPEILADEGTRRPYAQLMRLNALLLGLALENLAFANLRTRTGRMVRVAETALTTLHGASQLAAAAPGFVEPFDVVRACAQLADLDLDDAWLPPHLPYAVRARPVDERWAPPPGGPAGGVVAVVGLQRLASIEEAVRTAPAGTEITAVLVSGDPAELSALARLALAEVGNCLRVAFPPTAWPRLAVVHDDGGVLAAAAGVPSVSDATESAVLVRDGRIVARAEGFGACHAAASAAA